MENKWVIKIVNDEPKSYYCLDSLNGKIIYNKYVLVDKDKIDIKDLTLYTLTNGKLEKDSDKVRLREIERLNVKKNMVKKTLHNLKTYYSEKEFVYKGKYLQRNRALGDRDNLNGVVTLLIASKQTSYNGWKVFNTETKHYEFITLTVQEMVELGLMMNSYLAKALQVENILLNRLETMTEEQMNKTNFEKEYEKLWTTT